MSKFEQIQAEVLELSRDERDRLLASLSFASRGSDLVLTRDEEHVFSVLCEICKTQISVPQFLEGYGRKKFAGRVSEILAYIADTRKYLRPVQLHGLITTCLKCLASELVAREIPTTPRNILNNLSMLPHAVDKRFPGYASAKLLHRIIVC